MRVEREVERKYHAPPGARVPDLAVVSGVAQVGGARTFDLSATYVDTIDLALARGRRVLRRRVGGADEGWHLKLPGDGADARYELVAELGPNQNLLRVPSSLRNAIAEVVGSAALLPVAQVLTRRVERDLRDEAGEVLAVLVDDEVSTRRLGGWGSPAMPGTASDSRPDRAWRELEVELVRAAPGLLDEVTASLRDAGFTQSASPSKLAQALGAAVQDAQLHVWSPDSPSGSVVLT